MKLNNIKKIFRSRYKYLSTPNADIVIFDAESHNFLLPVIPDSMRYFVLESRVEVIYFNLHIIIKGIYHSIVSRSLIVGYFSAVFNYLQPKIVITYIDNGKMFYWVSRYYKDCSFLAIQNASRFDIRNTSKERASDIFLPFFACFGNYEVDLYTDKGANVGQFFPVGSLKNDSYIKESFCKTGANFPHRSYDICFVCEPSPGWDHIEGDGFEDALGIIAGYALKYATDHGKTIHFAGKRDENTQERQQEIEWYRKYIGDAADEITANQIKTFKTYQLIDASSVSLGFISTAFIEGMSRGNRCLQCNFTNDDKWDFPFEGPWFLKKSDYESFEKSMDYLLDITDEKFIDEAGEITDYMLHHDESETAIDFLKEYITNVK